MKMSWQYIAGFFDGEGCISMVDMKRSRKSYSSAMKGIKNRPTKKLWVCTERAVRLFVGQADVCSMRFQACMVQNENPVLFAIQKFLKKNGIEAQVNKRKPTRLSQQPFSMLLISRYEDVRKVLKKMLPYLIVKKSRAQIAIGFIDKKWGTR